MPLSWFAANSIGWNFDAVALIQSAGKYKSYQDWSQAEKNQAKREREIRKAQARLKEAERNRELEERRLNEEIARKAEEDRLRVEQRDRDARIQQELKEWNDPVIQQEREESHRRHLLSVGCIDEYGQVIRTFFCLNTQAPRE
jgi:murein DD-endopeptidase MepM/ murein hydrolase activator NlpD